MSAKDEGGAEVFLRKAMCAKTARVRAIYAWRGLSLRAPLERTTHAMLLRQLYLSHYEARRFRRAHAIARAAVELNVLADVLLQDAARAALAAGDLEAAVMHLREAARRCPASRRPFHLWTLGSILFLAARYDEATIALERALCGAKADKPLYRAHLALVCIAGGRDVSDLQATIDALAKAPCGQGYGRFVLGHLAYAAGEWGVAKRYLEAFLSRTFASRPALGIALEGEIRMTAATLAKIASS
ncbi:MAG: tetratricopeptide repeat protein [Polyangiaceae bacterium]|nr:tetratricopeptide repeat protein [Polyangiaceae bacterium]